MGIFVVGLGSMGQHHTRVCHDLGLLSGVCDLDPARAKAFGERFRVPYWDTLEGLLEAARALPDEERLCSIAVPTSSHFTTAKALLEDDFHVLLEKPMTDDLDKAEELVRLSKERKRILAIGYIETYNPSFNRAKQLVGEGRLGSITSVNIKRVGGTPGVARNVILDLMTHDLGLLFSLFGKEPEFLFSCQHEKAPGFVDSAQALMSFGDTTATCEANWVSPVKTREMVITGTQGICHVDLITQTLSILWRQEVDPSSPQKPYAQEGIFFEREPLKEEIESFYSAATLKDSNIVTGGDGVSILRMTLKATKEAVPQAKE
jgi:UDP-N-acetylglucosamine 3-dehydrogenase